MDPGRLPGIDLRQATLRRVFGGLPVPPWPFVFGRPTAARTERMGQWHANPSATFLASRRRLKAPAACANQCRYRNSEKCAAVLTGACHLARNGVQ